MNKNNDFIDSNTPQEPQVERETDNAEFYVTKVEVEQMIQNALSSLRLYVLESDITQAQNNVKTIVEHSTF